MRKKTHIIIQSNKFCSCIKKIVHIYKKVLLSILKGDVGDKDSSI